MALVAKLARIFHEHRREAPRDAGGCKAGEGFGTKLYENILLRSKIEPNAADIGIPPAAVDGS